MKEFEKCKTEDTQGQDGTTNEIVRVMLLV